MSFRTESKCDIANTCHYSHWIVPICLSSERKRSERYKRTRRRVLISLLIILLVFLDFVALAVAMGVLSTQLATKQFVVQDSSRSQPFGPLKGSIAPSVVAEFNTFWYESLTISQLDNNYAYQLQLKIFFLPRTSIKTSTFHTITSDTGDIDVENLYLLQGSTVTFQLQITSDTFEASIVNISLFDNYEDYTKVVPFDNYTFAVSSYETTTFRRNFTAHRNAFYYFRTCYYRRSCMGAYVVNFSLESNIRYLNSSSWKKHKGTFIPMLDSEVTIFHDSSFLGMMSNEDYVVIADTTEQFTPRPGQLHVTQHRRNLVYVNPALAAAGLLVLYGAVLSCVCICFFVRRKRKKDGEELPDVTR